MGRTPQTQAGRGRGRGGGKKKNPTTTSLARRRQLDKRQLDRGNLWTPFRRRLRAAAPSPFVWRKKRRDLKKFMKKKMAPWQSSGKSPTEPCRSTEEVNGDAREEAGDCNRIGMAAIKCDKERLSRRLK